VNYWVLLEQGSSQVICLSCLSRNSVKALKGTEEYINLTSKDE